MVTKDGYSVMNNNMNNVDIDREMSLMAENQLRYNTYIQEINERIKMMRTAVEGR
jgi:flagellar basal-body rod protein FlgB